MRIRFIINPISGTGKQHNIKYYIGKYFNDYEIFYTEKRGDASIISKDAVEKNIDAVIAVGGDGTVNECLKSLTNTSTALGVIPCGSGNGFAYHIGMYKKPKKCLKQIKEAQIKRIDSCIANNIPFVNVSGVGFDAHIAKLFSKEKERGLRNYIKLILKELNYKPQEYSIKYDKVERKVKAYMISFANGSQYGNNVIISPRAKLDDSLLDFVIVKEFPKWKIPLFLIQIATGNAHLSQHVEIIQSREMKIQCKNTLLHLDGESKESNNPIEVNLLPKSLKILIPNEK